MPSFYIRLCRCESVLMSADILVNAESAVAARTLIQKQIDDGEDFDSEEWFVSSISNETEAIDITDLESLNDG